MKDTFNVIFKASQCFLSIMQPNEKGKDGTTYIQIRHEDGRSSRVFKLNEPLDGHERKNNKRWSEKEMSELTTKEETQLAVVDFSADADAGLENARDKESVAIPFLNIVQKTSKVLETNDGARAGDFHNTITNTFSKELDVIPCAFERVYLRFTKNRNFRGKFSVAEIEGGLTPGVERSADGRNWTIRDNPDDQPDELQDARQHYVLMRDPQNGTWNEAILTLKKTQIQRSKQWLTRIRGIRMKDSKGKEFTPPSFSHVYTLTTIDKNNEHGSWKLLQVDLKKPVDDPRAYAQAKAFWEMAQKGKIETTEHTAD